MKSLAMGFATAFSLILAPTKILAAPKSSTPPARAAAFESQTGTTLQSDVQKAIEGLRAARGNSNSGGSLALANQLLQQKRRLPNQAPLRHAYQNGFIPAMQRLATKMPWLAKFLDERLHQLTWYVIPIEFQPLATELTGLPFLANHPAVQTPSDLFKDGAEIYVTEASLTRDLEMQTNMLVNEVVESIFMTQTPFLNQSRTTIMKTVKEFSFLVLNHDHLNAANLKSQLIQAASNGTSHEPTELGKYSPQKMGNYGVCNANSSRIEYGKRILSGALNFEGYLSDENLNLFKSIEPCRFISIIDSANGTIGNSLSKSKLFATADETQALLVQEQKFSEAKEQAMRSILLVQTNTHEEARRLMSQLKNEFDSNIETYAKITKGLFEKLEGVCAAAIDPRQFDRGTQAVLPPTPDQAKQFIQRLAPAIREFAETILTEYYRTSYLSAAELQKLGLRPEFMTGPFRTSGILQMLLLDDLRFNRAQGYYITPANWSGGHRIMVNRSEYNTTGFKIYDLYGIGNKDCSRYCSTANDNLVSRLPYVLPSGEVAFNLTGVDILKLDSSQMDLNYFLRAAAQVNYAFCNRLPEIRQTIDSQVRGEFKEGFAEKFMALIPAHLRKSVQHLVSKKEL